MKNKLVVIVLFASIFFLSEKTCAQASRLRKNSSSVSVYPSYNSARFVDKTDRIIVSWVLNQHGLQQSFFSTTDAHMFGVDDRSVLEPVDIHLVRSVVWRLKDLQKEWIGHKIHNSPVLPLVQMS